MISNYPFDTMVVYRIGHNKQYGVMLVKEINKYANQTLQFLILAMNKIKRELIEIGKGEALAELTKIFEKVIASTNLLKRMRKVCAKQVEFKRD